MQSIINTQDFQSIDQTIDQVFNVGENGVVGIWQSNDAKITIVTFSNSKSLFGINTRGGFITYYPLSTTTIKFPIKAILMDLDGTTLYSEDFWIYVIQETMRSEMKNPNFTFADNDIPFVSGHSVSEHLEYCINKYYPSGNLNHAIDLYYEHSRRLLKKLINGDIDGMQIKPADNLKNFLYHLKSKNIKIGLVTSGHYEKAYPEISNVCSQLDLGKPEEFYDSIITAGDALKPHRAGTLGELSAKPHPWLYLETALVGLGLSLEDRENIIGIEDSGAGICSLRAAGIPCIALKHGNVIQSGLGSLCNDICENLDEIWNKYL